MRFSTLLLASLLLASLSDAASAQVLLPEDYDQTEAPAADMGLIPSSRTQPPSVTTPAPTTTPAAPQQDPVKKPSGTSKTKVTATIPDVIADKMNGDTASAPNLSELRKLLPPELKNISDEQLEKLINSNLLISNDEIKQKYMRTDPQTGAVVIDFDGIERDLVAKRNAPLALSPGGTVASMKPTLSKKEQYIAKMVGTDVVNNAALSRQINTRKSLQAPPIIVANAGFTGRSNAFMTSSISTSISNSYIWGQNDAIKIMRVLGYTVDQIPSACQLRLDVVVNTSDSNSSYALTIMSGEQARIPYNGVISGLDIRPFAVCAKPSSALPQSGRVIMDYRGKYAVQLDKASCNTPQQSSQARNTPPTSVVLQYNGDSKVACTFMK